MIDTKKPLRFRMPDMRPVQLVGTMPNGDLIIVTKSSVEPERWATAPLIFEQNGRMRGGDNWSPVLVNEVETTKMYIRVNATLQHRQVETSAHLTDPQGTAIACIELVMEDGIAVSASLYRANTQPFRNKPGL